MNTYFKVSGYDKRLFMSRDEAVKQIGEWKTDTRTFFVSEIQNTEVTRKSAKGSILTEKISGSLEKVPRIISVKTLPTTYVVRSQSEGELPSKLEGWQLKQMTHYTTKAEAEVEATQQQSELSRLAQLTESYIKEVQVLTLADILERNAEAIERLDSQAKTAWQYVEALRTQTETAVASQVAELENQIATLKAKAAQDSGLTLAEANAEAAQNAYYKAIHFDDFKSRVDETLSEQHDCSCDRDCRYAREESCTYEGPNSDDIEQYLLENADDFELAEPVA